MAPSFDTVLASWHDFYLLVGTGAFTLIGLMFVAVTFGAHLMNQKNLVIARAFLDPTIIHFVQVLVISGIALVPGMGHELFGGLLVAVGVLSLLVLVKVYQGFRTAQDQYNDMELSDWVTGFFIPLVVYIGFVGCGIAFYMGQMAFSLLAVLTILILLISIYSAWELILWFAIMRRPKAPRKNRGKKSPRK
jgi:hypothetical protein